MVMAAPNKKEPAQPGKGKMPTNEQIVAGFNQLRQEQRAIASKLSELELELNEHRLLTEFIERLTTQVVTKGKEINEYREKFNIKVRGEQETEEKEPEESSSKTATQSVLVGKQSQE
ncbi:PREDICTED: prefoldin subunit 2-like [Priapulus caudatus]|uniref:Prefoldin subunit 2-like n=1 Tax=Priapulus caudatus TaxID=37621 RepID=A0ABM1EE28_PRICU|nr:PREDICTED: prefoldin subunit 2-like [Priapulus caudatus]